MKRPAALVVADDHAIFRQGLRSLLATHRDEVTIVGEVERLDALDAVLAAGGCEILLLDLQMERNALSDLPRLAARLPVVVLTANERSDDLLVALRAGASAIVLKRFAVETLLDAIRAVRAGHVWVPPVLQKELAAIRPRAERESLTRRELEVVREVAYGRKNVEVARRLFISEETVKTHLTRVFRKLAVRDRMELMVRAIQQGWVDVHNEPRPQA